MKVKKIEKKKQVNILICKKVSGLKQKKNEMKNKEK